MGYRPPAFPLVCHVVHKTPIAPPQLQEFDSPCQLKLYYTAAIVTANVSLLRPVLKLPRGTPVRNLLNTGASDHVEVPKDSGRWYIITHVEDAYKGFVNEYRVAVLVQTAQDGAWPFPIP